MKLRRSSVDRRLVQRLGLHATFGILLACDGNATATYDLSTSRVTVTGEVSGRSKQIEVTAQGPGQIVIDDPDCGRIPINITCAGPTTVKIKCGDPVLAEIPAAWTFLNGSYETTGDPSGEMLITAASSYDPPLRGPIVTDPGFTAVVVEADSVFEATTSLNYIIQFDTNGHNAEGEVLKAIEVAVVTQEQGGASCAPQSLEVPDHELDPDFTVITDPSHSTTVRLIGVVAIPTLYPVGILVLAALVLLAGAAAIRRRRRS